MNLIFICSEKTNFPRLFKKIQKDPSTYALRRFVIIDANIQKPSPNELFQQLSNEIGFHQPQLLRLPNDAITFGSIEPLKSLYEKYTENKNEGICIIVAKEPEGCFDYFKNEGVDVSKIEIVEFTENKQTV